jgi:hypothetical protein
MRLAHTVSCLATAAEPCECPGVTRRNNRARHAGHRGALWMRNESCAAVLLAPEVHVTALTTQNNADGPLLTGFGGGDEPGFSVPPALIVTSSHGIVGNLHYRTGESQPFYRYVLGK